MDRPPLQLSHFPEQNEERRLSESFAEVKIWIVKVITSYLGEKIELLL